jgi:ParB family chromosome partitioning protein
MSDADFFNKPGAEEDLKVKESSSDLPKAGNEDSTSHSTENKYRTVLIREVNPIRCKPWKYHNRDMAWLTTERCADLIHSIQQHGQNEPALVREIKGDPNYDFELIYGVRRWFACSVIPNQKLLVQVTNVDDKTCMILMHSENACSKDITEFERAFSFAQQMKSGVFKNQTELAKAMGISQGTISKMIKAAEILENPWIKDLFQHKLDISVKYAYALSVLLKEPRNVDFIKKEAMRIYRETRIMNRYKSASDILKKLIAASKNPEEKNASLLDSIILSIGDKAIVRYRQDKIGKLCIFIEDESKMLNRREVEAACLKAIADYYELFPGE